MSKKGKKKEKTPAAMRARTSSRSAPWRIHFFQRHAKEDANRSVPGRVFLLACPDKVRAMMLAVLKAVAEAPPPMFAGGGKWEAMHGDMNGFYEVRVDGPGRHHYRLFCVLEHDDGKLGLGGPSVVIICGKDKPFARRWPRRTMRRRGRWAQSTSRGRRAVSPRSYAA